MALPSLPEEPFSVGSSPTVRFLVDKPPLGDAYVQSAARGLNNRTVSWAVRWNALSSTRLLVLTAFLDARKGSGMFLWRSPLDAAPVAWSCETYRPEILDSSLWGLQATFERRYP